jgi:hypothetical protein
MPVLISPNPAILPVWMSRVCICWISVSVDCRNVAKSICRCGAAHEKVFNYDCNGMAAQRCPDGTESGVVPLYAVSGLLLPFVWDSRENHQHFKERLLQIETPFSILNQTSYFCSAEFLCLIPIYQ